MRARLRAQGAAGGSSQRGDTPDFIVERKRSVPPKGGICGEPVRGMSACPGLSRRRTVAPRSFRDGTLGNHAELHDQRNLRGRPPGDDDPRGREDGGECWLQIYYMKYGLHKSRYAVEDKVHKKKVQDIGGQIILDAERCILCSRGIRFLPEVTGTGGLRVLPR